MKRPMLICGITLTAVSAFLILYSKTATLVTVILAASVLILYLIKPLKLRKHIIIPAVCIFTLIISIQFSIYTSLKITPLNQYDGQIADISGKVVTLPETDNGYTELTLEADSINYNEEKVKIEVILSEESAENIKLYDYISLKGAELSVPRNDKNDYDLTAASDGIWLTAYSENSEVLWECEKDAFYYCLTLKKTVSDKIDLYLVENTAGILKGMLFGGSNNIDKTTLNAFRSSGIAHLLAVSGLHTSLWCGLLMSLLNFFKANDKIKSIICIFFLILLCIVSGFTPSVTRASLMMLTVLIAPFFKKSPDSLNSLGLAVTVLLLCNPYTVASISFQLSVAATLGVLIAVKFEKRITKITNGIKFKPVKKIADYILSSFTVSAFSSLFALPVSAYHFGIFCIFSPLTNLLCVQLAFYGMITGVISTSLAFINIHFVQDIAILIFRITDLILNTVARTAQAITRLEFCTIPVHKEWLICGILIFAAMMLTGYLFSKRKGRKYILPITAVISVIALFISIFIPILPTPFADTVTVVSSGNNINIVVRSGLHYAYILNTTEAVDGDVYSYLPKATCEELDYFLVPYISIGALTSLSSIGDNLKPTETHINETTNQMAFQRNTALPQNTVIDLEGKYELSDKISIEIVDTYRMQYAIIKGNEKTVLVHLNGNTDFSEVIDTSEADIFIYNGTSPEKIPTNAQTVIISADGSIFTDNNLADVKNKCSDVRITATDGDIQFTI